MGMLRKFKEDAVGSTSLKDLIPAFTIESVQDNPIVIRDFFITTKTAGDYFLQRSNDAGSSFKTIAKIRALGEGTFNYDFETKAPIVGRNVAGVEKIQLKVAYKQDTISDTSVTIWGETKGKDIVDDGV